MTKRIYLIFASLMLIGSTPCIMAKKSAKQYLNPSAEKSTQDSITVSGRFCNISEGMLRQKESTVRVAAKNVDGYDLSYHRSYNGAWLSTFTPIKLDSDSVFILKMPNEGIERMMVIANDPNRKLPDAYKSFYVMPGVTEVSIDPLADNKVIVSAPSRNKSDGNAADIDDNIYDLWYSLATGGKDQFSIYSDTVPASVSAKLAALTDSLLNQYDGMSAEIANAARRDSGLCALMVFQSCYNKARRKNKHLIWEKELARMRDEIDLNNPENARSPYFDDIMQNFFFHDCNPKRISPDSLLQLRCEHILTTLSGKAAEAALGLLLYKDGDNNTFSPSAQFLTDKFKSLFPNSGLIPFLDEKLEANLAFNAPKTSEEIVFLDNSSLKTLDQLFASYSGKTVLIDIWATWCGPCRKSFEHVKPLQEYAAENDIQLLYISVDEQEGIGDKWKKMVTYYDLKGHHVMINSDVKQEVYSTFGNSDRILSIPCYAVIDRNGNLSLLGSDLAESTDITQLRKLLDNIK